MLTDPKLKAQVDQLWDKFWTSGLTNPLDTIARFSYLLSKLNTAGRNGQFRTPRHLIRIMVQMVAQRATERTGSG